MMMMMVKRGRGIKEDIHRVFINGTGLYITGNSEPTNLGLKVIQSMSVKGRR